MGGSQREYSDGEDTPGRPQIRVIVMANNNNNSLWYAEGNSGDERIL